VALPMGWSWGLLLRQAGGDGRPASIFFDQIAVTPLGKSWPPAERTQG